MQKFPEVRVRCADEERSGLILVRIDGCTAYVCHPKRATEAGDWEIGFPVSDVFYASSGAAVGNIRDRTAA